MIVRRTLSLIAIALVMMVGAAVPAMATDYPITDGPGTQVGGTKTGTTGTTTEGTRTPTGVNDLARTGAELTTLWLGLGLLATGGVIVMVSRNRRRVTA